MFQTTDDPECRDKANRSHNSTTVLIHRQQGFKTIGFIQPASCISALARSIAAA